MLEVAALSGVALRVQTEIDAAAPRSSELAASWGPDADSDSLAKRVAQRVHKTCVCVYGAGPTAPVAMRWKTQINENAKVPAFWAELPEADHNEIVGWDRRSSLGSFMAVFLEDADQHPRVRQRMELTAALIEPEAAGTLRLESQGVNRGRARAVAGAARGPGLGLPGGAAGDRPHAGARDRAPEGGAGARGRSPERRSPILRGFRGSSRAAVARRVDAPAQL